MVIHVRERGTPVLDPKIPGFNNFPQSWVSFPFKGHGATAPPEVATLRV